MSAWVERFNGVLLLIGLAAVTLVSVFYRGRATGRQAERQERSDQINEQAAQAHKEVRDVQLETARMGDDDVAAELERDWVRRPGEGRR